MKKNQVPKPIKQDIFYGSIFLWFLIVLSGCASLPVLPGAKVEQIADRQVEYVLVKHTGTDTVVFENGFGVTMDMWPTAFSEISKDTTAFTYNRPGYGKSAATTTPRDGIHIVDELRTFLHSKDLNPPYILVGHSLGGLYMQLFARRYPAEVKALILVDSVHPLKFKGKGSPENWPLQERNWKLAMYSHLPPMKKGETQGIDKTGEAVLALPTFAGKPVIVLSAAKLLKEKSERADDDNEKRKDIARLYPGSKQIWVDCGHRIPLENPESIVAAIREVLSRK